MRIKTVLLLLFFGFIACGEVLQACPLSVGSYRGKAEGGFKTDLMLKKVPGRKGSFYALLRIKGKNKRYSNARLYMVDKEKKATCLMYRLGSSEDGYLAKEEKPEMVINISKDKKGRTIFTLSQEGSSDYYIFGTKRSKSAWYSFLSGEFKQKKKKQALRLSDKNEFGEATAVFLGTRLKGNYILSEKGLGNSGIYFVKKISRNEYGDVTEAFPKQIGIFEKSCLGTFGCEKHLILIKPNTTYGTVDHQFDVFKKK